MTNKISVKERGWKGHLCVADYCRFARNTLVGDYPNCVIVSTVGVYIPKRYFENEKISLHGHYETKMFRSCATGSYIDVDPSREIFFEGKCYVDGSDLNRDFEANEMHEAAVLIAVEMIEEGRIHETC